VAMWSNDTGVGIPVMTNMWWMTRYHQHCLPR
jgi:hypothetical protein